MKTIWKYEIKPSHEIQEIILPFGSRFLSVIEQDMKLQLYVSVEHPKSAHDSPHRYIVVGTGWDLEFVNEWFKNHIGTVIQGPFVWHVFELEDLPF